MHIASIGVDLGKTTFHLVALGEQSKVVVKKKFSRKQLLFYSADPQSSADEVRCRAGFDANQRAC
jgi:transposase